MERISWIVAGLCVLLLLQIIRAVRREHIRVEYSMAWFGAASILLVLSLWDAALEWLGVGLGIADVCVVLRRLAGSGDVFWLINAKIILYPVIMRFRSWVASKIARWPDHPPGRRTGTLLMKRRRSALGVGPTRISSPRWNTWAVDRLEVAVDRVQGSEDIGDLGGVIGSEP